MRRIGIFVLLLLAITVGVSAKNVALIYNPKSLGLDSLINTFYDKLTEQNHNVIKFSTLEGSEVEIIEDILNSGCDAVFSVGDKATSIADKTNLIGLFTLVQDPVNKGLVDPHLKPTRKLTGLSIFPHPEALLKLLERLSPGKTRLGIVYNPQNSGEYVRKLQNVASDMYFDVTSEMVFIPKNVVPAFEKMRKKINILIAVNDTSLYDKKNLEKLAKFSKKTKYPLIGLHPNMTELGALVSAHTDPFILGNEAGDVMLKILETSSIVEFDYPKEMVYSINLESAKKIRMKILRSVIKGAYKVLG